MNKVLHNFITLAKPLSITNVGCTMLYVTCTAVLILNDGRGEDMGNKRSTKLELMRVNIVA